MTDDEGVRFNSSLKTSDYVREWCNQVGELLLKQSQYQEANHRLWMVNNEIHGWYCKKGTVLKNFKELRDYESKAETVKSNLNSMQSRVVYGKVLRDWSRKAIEHCYQIGWLADEKKNIYDADLI